MGSTGTNGVSHSQRVIVFDNPSQHPDFKQIWHPYLMTAFIGANRPQPRWKHSEERQKEILFDQVGWLTKDTYGSATLELEERVAKIENAGKSCWISEHCDIFLRQDVICACMDGHKFTPRGLGNNPTYLPDWLFATCTPVIVIRHPALAIQSLHIGNSNTQKIKPDDEDFEFLASLYYARILFDLFKSQGRTPVVVDGEDVVLRTQEMTDGVCKAIGIDPQGVKQTWKPIPEEDRHPNPVVRHFITTLYDSTGVEQPAEKRPYPPNLDEEYQRMEKKFGKEIADGLKVRVEENMEHYEYLKQFKV